MSKYYSGIGARSTPSIYLELMKDIASILEAKDMVLRSGGARGADVAFQAGITNNSNMEIYRPEHATDESRLIASQFHSKWDALPGYIKNLHGRNAKIILGNDLNTPSSFVLCYTPDGRDSGGTGLGIRIANSYGVRVYNFYFNSILKQFVDKIENFIMSNSHFTIGINQLHERAYYKLARKY